MENYHNIHEALYVSILLFQNQSHVWIAKHQLYCQFSVQAPSHILILYKSKKRDSTKINKLKSGRFYFVQKMKQKKARKRNFYVEKPIQKSNGNNTTHLMNQSSQISKDISQNDDQQYKIQNKQLLPRLQKQKNYRKFNQIGIRRVKTVACQCLKQMKLKSLYKFWAKKTQGERNKRYIILLVIMIVSHEGLDLVLAFIQVYKNMCLQILSGKHQKFKKDYNSPHFLSIKHNLNLSIKAAEKFIQSDFNIDSGLKIMQNQIQNKYYKQAKKKLQEYQILINQDRHKKYKINSL